MHVYLFYKKINVLKWIITRGRLIAILLFEGEKGGNMVRVLAIFLTLLPSSFAFAHSFSGMKMSVSSFCSFYWHEFIIIVMPTAFMPSVFILIIATVLEDVESILLAKREGKKREFAVDA